ncbi:MAG: hypothetical protein AAB875_06225 [Patescibacteria group bacterium]
MEVDESSEIVLPKVFAHRAGWARPERTPEGMREQNSIPRAKETLQEVSGCEVDVGFTKDGVAVVTHDDVSRLSFEQFKKANPDHASLESWVDWFTSDELKDKELYLDLKGTQQDPYRLIEAVNTLGDRVSIGSKDPQTVFKLLLARKLLNSRAKVYLQIPEPVHPPTAVRYAENLLTNIGIRQEDLNEEEKALVSELKPDGLHFYWPENLAKDIISELSRHGDFYPAIEAASIRRNGRLASIVPNIVIFHDLQRARLEHFTRLAKQKGYEVVGGSTASPLAMKRMLEWGVDAVMPNNPEVFINHLVPPYTPTEDRTVADPADRFIHTKDVKEHDLNQELHSSQTDETRKKYLSLAVRTKKISVIRQQFGI